jgi:hypothetical protein
VKRTTSRTSALCVVPFLLSLGLSVDALAGSVTVVSDNTWNVFGPDPTDPTILLWLGLSQRVCLNGTSPANCLMGVTPAPTVYGYRFSGGWNANIAGLPPTARWMWAPNVTGASSPAQSQAFSFEKDDVYVCDPPQDATISIAADNSAEVWVNGLPVPGSTSTDHMNFTTFRVPAASIYGSSVFPPNPRPNRVTIKASNGLNPADCTSGKYECNPAGVIFWGSFKFAGDPKCTPWKPPGPLGGYSMGEKEKLSDCPSGQIGSVSHTCVCGAWLPAMNTCVSLPQCVGTGTTTAGTRFPVGAVEAQTCLAGQSASPSSHKCLNTGDWDVPLGTCVSLPQCVGTGTTTAGTRFPVGAVEAQTCVAGQSASPSSHKCLNTGDWDVPLGTCQTPPPPPVTCPGGIPIGTTEPLTCSVGTGSPTRTCVAGGTWQTNGSCLLREGDICGSSQNPYIQACLPGSCIAQCPANTDCRNRRIGRGPLVTTDWYCDRP